MVCVKFPPQSVDEVYLRKLTEPFGKIIKILMFPSLVSPKHRAVLLHSLLQHITALYHCVIYI